MPNEDLISAFYRMMSHFIDSGQRAGQAAFNAATHVFPKEAEQARSTELDCFYLDERIPDFLAHIMKETNDE